MANPTYWYLDVVHFYDKKTPGLKFDPNVWTQSYHPEVSHTHPKSIPIDATKTQIEIIQGQARADLEVFYKWLQLKDTPAFKDHTFHAEYATKDAISCCEAILNPRKPPKSCCTVS